MADHEIVRLLQLLFATGGGAVSFCTGLDVTHDARWARRMGLDRHVVIMARLLVKMEWSRFTAQVVLMLSGVGVILGYFQESDSRSIVMAVISTVLYVQTMMVRAARRRIDKGA